MDGKREIRLEELDFRGILRDVVKNIWLVILMALACYLGVTSVMKLTYQAEYSSSATIAIMAKSSSGNTYSSLSAASSMAEVLAKIFQGNVLKSMVAADLDVNSFQGSITAEVVDETNLLQVSVTADTPKEAYLGMQSVLNHYLSVSDYIFGNAAPEVISFPQIPVRATNSAIIQKTQQLAILGGTMLTTMIIVLLSVLRFTVKNRKMAVRCLEGKYLGTLLHEEKNDTFWSKVHSDQKGILISSPVCSASFAESTRKLAARIEHHLRKNRQKLLLVSSIEENEGKTTVAANLALGLASKGYRVLLMDLDLRKPAVHKLFEKTVEEKKNLESVLKGGSEPQNAWIYDEKTGIFLLMNRSIYSNSQDVLVSDNMQTLFNAARQHMDYVIIDTPPQSISADAEIISSLADASIMIVRYDWADMRDINDGIDVMKQGKGEFLGYVLNDIHERLRRGK